MKLEEYIKLQVEGGMTLTRALSMLPEIVCASEPTVWRWHKTGKTPAYAERLMQVWAEANAPQRERWFK